MSAAFYQVLVGLKPTFQIAYPDNFRSVMKAFNWVDLDWDELAYPEGELYFYDFRCCSLCESSVAHHKAA